MNNNHSSPDVKILKHLGEFFAAGFLELYNAPPFRRYSRAYRRWFENCGFQKYDDNLLFPSGKKAADAVMEPDYSFTMKWNEARYKLLTQGASGTLRKNLEQLRRVYTAQRNLYYKFEDTPHFVGGKGYTHAIINYGRVMSEGIDSYEARIKLELSRCTDEKKAFYEGLADVVIGLRSYHGRIQDYLKNNHKKSKNAARLIEAFGQVPFKPSLNYYQAMVCYNFLYYIDGCDNPGRIDQELFPYYAVDDSTGRDLATDLMREFFDNICANKGWSCAIGGTAPDGTGAYNEITEICIEASHKKYRPSIELRVREDMPAKLWRLSADAISTGCGQPALYNETAYIEAIKSSGLGVTDEDALKWNGGGCTETMIHGCSNVGSLDAGINLLFILEQTLLKTLSDNAITFEEILALFKNDIRVAVKNLADALNKYFLDRSRHNPQPIRSLFIDDCIASGRDFNAGGARYNWSVINVAGIANVADSLEALQQTVFEKKCINPPDLLKLMKSNYEGNAQIRQQLLNCDKFGNDLDGVDAKAADIAEFTYKTLSSQACARGKFIPSNIMFETFAEAGSRVGATPDGRPAKTPVSDSAGPMQGKDTKGITAMLKSVARLPLHLAWGTPVLNIKLSRSTFNVETGRKNFENLIKTFFKLGGMQIQISVLDRAELIDAMDNPKAHEGLIVRIGGYSTHFNWLSDELKQEVIKRTEYIL